MSVTARPVRVKPSEVSGFGETVTLSALIGVIVLLVQKLAVWLQKIHTDQWLAKTPAAQSSGSHKALLQAALRLANARFRTKSTMTP